MRRLRRKSPHLLRPSTLTERARLFGWSPLTKPLQPKPAGWHRAMGSGGVSFVVSGTCGAQTSGTFGALPRESLPVAGSLSPREVQGSMAKVMVVDDAQSDLRLMEAILQSAGHQVVAYADGITSWSAWFSDTNKSSKGPGSRRGIE